MIVDKKIYIIGIGSGVIGGLTLEAKQLIETSDIIFGARRMLQILTATNHSEQSYQGKEKTKASSSLSVLDENFTSENMQKKRIIEMYQAEKIQSYLQQQEDWKQACILLSGDVGFYSGAKKLVETLTSALDEVEGPPAVQSRNCQRAIPSFSALDEVEGPPAVQSRNCQRAIPSLYEVYCIPGISSVALFSARLCIPWEHMELSSIHGRRTNLIAKIRTSKYTFSLLSSETDVHRLCEKLIWYGLTNVRLYIGENLGYENEKIYEGTPTEILQGHYEALCVLIAYNPNPEQKGVRMIADEEFIRGKVPMSKMELRTLSMLKLSLTENAVLYDVGAGTGSVSIQAALSYPEAQVYAIEKNPEALGLIEQNKKKLIADNVEIIAGTAPEALQELPAPTHVFLGGSSGNMREIFQTIWEKNPKAVVVVTVVAVESYAEIIQLTKEFNISKVDITQVSIARAEAVGRYHLMKAQNPVMMIYIDPRV